MYTIMFELFSRVIAYKINRTKPSYVFKLEIVYMYQYAKLTFKRDI